MSLKNNKKQAGSAWNFSCPNISVWSASIPYCRVNPPFFCSLLFFQKYLNSQIIINKMISKHSLIGHPSLSRLTLKICILSYFCKLLRDLILCRIYVYFSLNPVYPPMVAEHFQMYGIQITRKCICKSKNWIYAFYSSSPTKTFLQVLIAISYLIIMSPKHSSPHAWENDTYRSNICFVIDS